MKLRNKKTGEIGNLKPYGEDGRIWVWIGNKSEPEYRYGTLAELNEEWEDYEEPKDRIDYIGLKMEDYDRTTVEIQYQTKEEAEKVVEKLKAWKRLRDKGFRFGGWEDCNGKINTIYFCIPENKWGIDTCDDLSICFGDEE